MNLVFALTKIQTNYHRTNFFLMFLAHLSVAPFIVMMTMRVLGA